MTSINTLNPFVKKEIIPVLSDWLNYDLAQQLKKDYIVELDAFDKEGIIINIDQEKVKIKFGITQEEYNNKFIINKETNKNYPINIRDQFGYLTLKINEMYEDDIYPYVIDDPKFNNNLDRLQNSKIKSFDHSGVIFDNLNPEDYNEFKLEIDKYANKTPKDFHPFSNNRVRDLIHPSMYPYIKGVSKIKVENLDITNLASQKTDYWNRPYEDSKYQWLPSEFKIDSQGNCKIDSYINNLGFGETKITSLLEKLFNKVLPKFESVWSYINTINLYDDENINLYDYNNSNSNNFDFITLKNRTLQVIPKIITVEMGQDSLEGAWHVEGMSHENIVASAVCVLEQTPELETNLFFKRRFTIREGTFISDSTGQNRPAFIQSYLNDGLLPLGKVSTKTGSLTVFPNSHIHKLDILNKSQLGKRTVVVFWLVNPDIRILSTKHIEPQQNTNNFNLENALQHRLKLMEERKFHKQNFNVRDLNLCEH
jgi:hypothetical protein